MLLKTLQLKNIRSYTDEVIEFPEGSLLLAGDIGCGKSTILLAIDFALFGLTRSELEGTDLLRHGKSFGSVELEFVLDDKNCKIKRTLKRSNSSIAQDSGLLVIDNRPFNGTATELKAKMLEMLGYPMEFLKKNKPVFRYTVYTPQEQMKHILLSDDRLEILRKIFNIDKYGQIKNNSKIFIAELRAMKRELESFSRDLEDKIKTLEDLRYSLNNLHRENYTEKEKLENIDRRLEKKQIEAVGLKSKIEESRNKRKDKEKLEIEVSGKINRLGRLEKEFVDVQESLISNEKEIYEINKIQKPTKTEDEIEELVSAADAERLKLLKQKAYTENDITKLSQILEKGFCVVCNQPVNHPESFSENIEKKKHQNSNFASKISELENTLFVLRKQEKDIMSYSAALLRKSKIEKDIELFLYKRSILEKEKTEIENDSQILRNKIENLESMLFDLRHLDESWKSLENEISAIRNEKLSAEKRIAKIEQQVEDIEIHIAAMEKEMEEKRKSRQKISIISELVSWLDDYFLALMDIMERNVMYTIQNQFNEYFQSWFGILMNDEQLSTRIGDRFETIVEQNGYETDYHNLSGGEKTAVALAYRLALNRVMNDIIENMKTKDIIILDEPTDGFSSDQLDRIRYVLEALKLKQVIIVSHEPKIDTFVDNVIRIHKDDHVSKIIR